MDEGAAGVLTWGDGVEFKVQKSKRKIEEQEN